MRGRAFLRDRSHFHEPGPVSLLPGSLPESDGAWCWSAPSQAPGAALALVMLLRSRQVSAALKGKGSCQTVVPEAGCELPSWPGGDTPLHPQDTMLLLPILRAAMCSWASFYISLTSQLLEAIRERAKGTSTEMNEGHLPLCLLSCHQKQVPLSQVAAKGCLLCSSCCGSSSAYGNKYHHQRDGQGSWDSTFVVIYLFISVFALLALLLLPHFLSAVFNRFYIKEL